MTLATIDVAQAASIAANIQLCNYRTVDGAHGRLSQPVVDGGSLHASVMAFPQPPNNGPLSLVPTMNAAPLLVTERRPSSAVAAARASTGSSNTYVMSGSPRKTTFKRGYEPYMPKIITTVGQRPACLVNASVTYVGNDQIYAFGGFDQYTDEGWSCIL